jgi:hypothetical protein
MADDIKIVGLSSKKSGGTNWKVISAIIGIVVLSIGVIAGILLVRQNQNIEEKALECNQGGFACPDPSNSSLLRDCSTGETFPNDTLCNAAGKIEICGQTVSSARQYCCPSAGGAWTADLSACSCAATGPTNLTVENLSPTSVKLKWTSGTGGTATRIWVSKNTDPTGGCATGGAANCIKDDQRVPLATTEYEVTGLTANTKYYWRLMTFAQSGCDAGTTVMNFTTTADSVATATATATATGTPSGLTVAMSFCSNDPTDQYDSCTACGGTGSVCVSKGQCNTYFSTCPTKTPTTIATATSTAIATATSTSAGKTATPTSTAKASSTATAKATASGSATAFPVPETGAEWPTVIGAGFGIVMLLVSLALAL